MKPSELETKVGDSLKINIPHRSIREAENQAPPLNPHTHTARTSQQMEQVGERGGQRPASHRGRAPGKLIRRTAVSFKTRKTESSRKCMTCFRSQNWSVVEPDPSKPVLFSVPHDLHSWGHSMNTFQKASLAPQKKRQNSYPHFDSLLVLFLSHTHW